MPSAQSHPQFDLNAPGLNGSNPSAQGSTYADDSILSDVGRALSEAGYRSLSRIRATVENGIVYLSGSVESWHLKQVAQEVVLQITGLGRVKNFLTVKQCPDETSSGQNTPEDRLAEPQLDETDIANLPDCVMQSMTRDELIAVIQSCPAQDQHANAVVRLSLLDWPTLLRLAFLARQYCQAKLKSTD
ncbi:MAG: BON domain-containing protein [Planctomycetaceae bacterium]